MMEENKLDLETVRQVYVWSKKSFEITEKILIAKGVINETKHK